MRTVTLVGDGLKAWAAARARGDRRANRALALAAVVLAVAWGRVCGAAEDAYWDALRLPLEFNRWLMTAAATPVSVRTITYGVPVTVAVALAARRAAGPRASSALWIAMALLAAAFAGAVGDELRFTVLVPVELTAGCSGFESAFSAWWTEVGLSLPRSLHDDVRSGALWYAGAVLCVVTAWVAASVLQWNAPRAARSLDRVARATVVASALLLAASAVRLVARPRPEGYVRSLPVVSVMRGVAGERDARALPSLGMDSDDPDHDPGAINGYFPATAGPAYLPESSRDWFRVEHAWGGLAFWRECRPAWRQCELFWQRVGQPRWRLLRRSRVEAEAVALRPRDEVRLRRDARHRLLFVEKGGHALGVIRLDPWRDGSREPTALDLPRNAQGFVDDVGWALREHVSLLHVADSAAPPPSYVALALAGLLAALALRALDRRAKVVQPPEGGHLDEWLREDDVERSLRTVGVIALTHAPLAVAAAHRLVV